MNRDSDKKPLTEENGTMASNSSVKVVQAAGNLKHRKKKKHPEKKKLNKFERRYSELGPLLKPEQKRIDYVLVHEAKTSEQTKHASRKEAREKKETMRASFEAALKLEGFSIKSVTMEKKVYKKLHCPFKRLCTEAEKIKLEMPLKGCEQPPPQRVNCVTEFIQDHFETDNEVDFISAPFKMNKIDLFEGYENPTYFFRPALRSFLTHHILINTDIRSQTEKHQGKILQKRGPRQLTVVEDFIADFCSCCPYFWGEIDDTEENKILQRMGLPYLLMKGVYEDAFILHEESELSDLKEKRGKNSKGGSNNKKTDLASVKKTDETPVSDEKKSSTFDPRKALDETWTCFWKFQPLWKIRNYFGEKIALYFAWSGMLITSLWIPMLFGFACFLFGISESATYDSGKVKPTNLSAEEEIKYELGELFDMLRGSFDNTVTPFFALVICLWGTMFLELWKRRNARLSYEWDVDTFEQNEPDRPQFFGTKVKKDPVTQEDNWFYPFKRQILKFCLSASALIFMVSIVFVSLMAVIVYRVIISVDFCPGQTAVECLISTTLVSALLNAVSILLLGKVYDWVAVKLTEWENHRTQTQYDDALIIKLFAFQFANSYASCIYIAFFRGRFDAFGVFGLGTEYSDACDGGSCMSQLSFQVLILMLAKPFPRLLKDLVVPFLKWLWRKRPKCCRSTCCKNQVTDEEKLDMTDSASLKASKEFLLKEHRKPQLPDFTLGEYTEKIILYGFLMLFAASFPLAPFLAMMILMIDLRVDAKRLLWLNRRPVAFIAEDIGMWYGILNFVNLCGVVSNGFLIAFTSSWGQQYDVTTQLWICIGFEHIVFALKFILAYVIPDVPKDVRLATRREKYQVQKKFEASKGKIQDYSELVPIMTANQRHNEGRRAVTDGTTDHSFSHETYRVREGSSNYADFQEPDDSDPDWKSTLAKDLATVVEEEEGAIPSEPKESVYVNNINQSPDTFANPCEVMPSMAAPLGPQNPHKGLFRKTTSDLWYVDSRGELNSPYVSFADSQGGVSMKEIDPEGSKLFQRTASTERLLPREEKTDVTPKTKPPPPDQGPPPGSPEVAETPGAPKYNPFMAGGGGSEDSANDGSPSGLHMDVDPYKVVTKQDMKRMKSQGSMSVRSIIDEEDTEC